MPRPARDGATVSSRTAYLLVGALTLLNLVQARFTELTSDEGYYWYLSTAPAWGHYDHPPLLPLLMHLGGSLVGGTLGVRLGGILCVSLGLVLLVRLLAQEGPIRPVLYLLVASLPLLQYLSFVMFPDTPLIGLSMAYLALYHRFLRRDDWPSALGLGAVLALMLYAKYHAVLLVAFVVLSNLRLLRSRRFLASLGFALLLFLPHLAWQYRHDFVSIVYHLSGRSGRFRPSNLAEYLVLQPLVLGPALCFVPFVRASADRFERALRAVAIGVPAFFLLATLRGYVHSHWTSLAIFPLLILGYRHHREGVPGVLRRLALTVAALVALARLYYMLPLTPLARLNARDWQHGRAAWARELAAVAGDRPVVFEARLRDAPLYAFYSGRRGYSLFPGEHKKSEYEIRQVEDSLQGAAVLVVQAKPFRGSRPLHTSVGVTEHYLPVERFASYENVRLELVAHDRPDALGAIRLTLTLVNHRATPLTFEPGPGGAAPLLVMHRYAASGRAVARDTLRRLGAADAVAPGQSSAIVVQVAATRLPAVGAEVSFGFDDGLLSPSVNSRRHRLSGSR